MWERAGMSLQTELELKFRVDREIFKTALTLPLLRAGNDERASEALESVYFDTEDLDLMRRRIALRVRRANGDYVLGVKKGAQAHGSYFERDEEQAPSAGAVADLSLLKKATAAELKEIVGEKALAPRFVSDIQRTLRTVRFHGAEIEVALDEGFISAGEQREPAHEIELELKSGEPAALFEFGLSLVDALPLKLGILSKAQRGAELFSGKPPEPVRAVSPDLAPDMSTDEGIGAILHVCLSQFLDNLPVLERGDSVEAVHQMHVAVRRLRSAFGLVSRFFPSAEFDALRDESKRIGVILGAARDWDVFIDTLRDGPLPSFADAPGFDKLINAARCRADAAHEAVVALASDRATARFALTLERFVARRGWRASAQDNRRRWLSEPIGGFAVGSLDRLHRKVLKRGKKFDSQTHEQRHMVRISLKHLRYATKFFGDLFHPASAAERYADEAAELQDLLGQRNDATIALRQIKALDFGEDAEFAFAAGVSAGWCARGGLADESRIREAWRSIRKAERFWRDDDAVRKGESS